MRMSAVHELTTVNKAADDPDAVAAELTLLRDVLKLLPAGVTVQDEHGRFLLVNDAAASQLGLSEAESADPLSPQLGRRREHGLELLRDAKSTVIEESSGDGQLKQVLQTSHRVAGFAGRNLVISASADISEQKAFEDQLFRSAYYDELTDLPMRRVIEHRVNSLLKQGAAGDKFALAFLDIDSFKHINDYYGHGIGDALLVQVARRLGRDLRETDMLSRISGDEFLLLVLSPVQSEHEVADFIRTTLERLKVPFFIDGSEIFASASIGISLYPDH